MRLLSNARTTPVVGLAFAPDGRTLVAGGSGGFTVHDLHAGTSSSFDAPHSRYVFAFVLDPLGRCLYLSEARGGMWIRDLATGQGRRFPGHEYDHHMTSVAPSGDGSRVAVSRGGSPHNRLECWSIASDGSLAQVWSLEAAQWSMFSGLAFHPDNDRLTSIEDGLPKKGRSGFPILLRDAATGTAMGTVGHIPRSFGIGTTFTRDGKWLLVWDELEVRRYDAAGGGQVRALPHPGRARFRALAAHPSSRCFATAANDGVARVWDIDSLSQTQAFAWKAGKLQSIAFSRDGMLAAAGTDKGQVVVWDVEW